VPLHPAEELEPEPNKMEDASAGLWKRSNYRRRQAFFSNRRIPSIQAQLLQSKDFKLLGTCKSQALLQRWDGCRWEGRRPVSLEI
jgi:hypothetical protein